MRRLTAILTFLTVAGCASGTHPHPFSAQVFEQRGRITQPASVSGQHVFVVRITNRSEETVAVDSVEIDPQTTSLQFYENALAVDEMMEPGETRDITMWINVNLVAANYVYTIDSVDVSITARSPSRGSFTDTIACAVIASR